MDLADEPEFRLGRLTAEPGRRLLKTDAGDEATLEPKVMQALIVLARADGNVVSRDTLRAIVWDRRVTSDDAIDRVVARIRRVSEGIGCGSFTLETIPKTGYRLSEIPAVIEAPATPEHAADAIPPSRFNRRFVIGSGVAALGATGLGLWALAPAPPLPGDPSIAVMPFAAPGGTQDLATYGEDIAAFVRADLSRVADLRVATGVSDAAASPRDVGRRFGASLVLAGQIISADTANRVSVTLIDTATGRPLWAETIQSTAGNRAAFASLVSGVVLQQVVGLVPFRAGAGQPPVRRPDPQAFVYVSEANRLLDDIRAANMRGQRDAALAAGDRAETLAQSALAIDGGDAGALVVLATITRNGWSRTLAARQLTTQQRIDGWLRLTRRALQADPNHPAALTQLADYYRRYAFRWNEAENLFRRALSFDPNAIEAHWAYANMLGTLGRAIEALDHALDVFRLAPENPFRRLALPRMLYLLGRRDEAMQRYAAELTQYPDNVFLLRELYFMFLSEGNVADLQALGARLGRQWPGSAPPDVAALIVRVRAGIDALQGRPATLRNLVEADVRVYEAPATSANATPQGRARDDLPYIAAIEFAWSDSADRAIAMLERALAAKSLYWPATLPFGIAPFPVAVRSHPRYLGLWQGDPGLRQFMERRRSAILTGQMAGFTPAGERRIPKLPEALESRITRALGRRN
ncbi:MAG: winged helix-turn-helix domain-containing protein [Pseudomonadota bacterium]